MIRKLAVVVGCSFQLGAQQPLTLAAVLESALQNYPSIRVAQEQMNAAAEGIRLARTAYLPRVDTTAQMIRATRNNVFVMTIPGGGLPTISGPVLGTNNFGTVWSRSILACGRQI